MQDFILKELVTKDIETELEKIGFDTAYRLKASDKFKYKTYKIFDLTLPQANILKQTALTVGADCGVHREVLVNNIDKTDVIIGGSLSQLKKICEKLKLQPFSLKNLAEKILVQLPEQNRKTRLVGILNITPDSFSDGGSYYEPEKAIKHFYQLLEDGADMIDIGAESTKPGSLPVSADVQIERLKNILEVCKDSLIPISVDTRNSEVARFALDNGVNFINDVSGLTFDARMADVISKYNAGVIIQHSTEKTSDLPIYKDVVEEIYLSLQKKFLFAKEKGIDNIIVDPGIGFGKSRINNFEILDRIEEFKSLNLPLMVGISRKSLLNIVENDNELKDSLSLALSYPLIKSGVDYLRVHNVKIYKKLIDLAI